MATATRVWNWIPVISFACALLVPHVLYLPMKCQPGASPSPGAQASSQDVTPTEATHRQVKFITLAENQPQLKLSSFCLTKDGKIVAVLHAEAQQSGSGGILSKIVSALSDGNSASTADSTANANGGGSNSNKPQRSPAEVRLLDADGKLSDTWPIDLECRPSTCAPMAI